MGKYKIQIEKAAQNDLKKHLKSGNKINIKRIDKIILELSKHPFSGIGKPEALKYELSGKWSREINKKDRLIYQVSESNKTVFVLSAMGHYSDK